MLFDSEIHVYASFLDCGDNLFELLNFEKLLLLGKDSIIKICFLFNPHSFQALDVSGTCLFHLGNLSKELLKPVFSFLRFENCVLKESDSTFVIVKSSNVVEELFFMLDSLFNYWSYQVLHGSSKFRFKY